MGWKVTAGVSGCSWAGRCMERQAISAPRKGVRPVLSMRDDIARRKLGRYDV